VVRVLFVLNSLCVGGAEKQVVSLVNRLDRSRFALSVLYLKPEETLRPQLEDAACADGIRCLGVSKGIEWPAIRAIAEHIERHQIDVMVCTNMYAQLYGWLARRIARRKPRLVEVFHTTDLGSRKERLSMALYKPLTRLADLLVYVCGAQARHWQREGLRARQDTVIYNGIDAERFVDRWSEDDKAALRAGHGLARDDYVVGLCAVMRPEKAHADLLSAIAALRARGVPIKGLLIGDGPLRAALEAQIDALGLRDAVRITGFLQDVRPAVAACDVLVLASHSVETFSLAALEAMALGRPMVMTEIGGAAEQVTPGVHGLLYPPGDLDALADRLATLHERTTREAMGARAAQRVRAEFDLAQMVEGYERTFSALVAGQQLPALRPDQPRDLATRS